MSESAKTLAFLAVAAATVAASFVAKPTTAIYDPNEQVGKMLTDSFEPELAKRLTVVKFDEETATLSEFEVSEQDGVWTLPSKGGYPADAFRQMAEATTGVTDREILSIASESAADHERFGVVDPRSPKLAVGQTGVGIRVTLADEDNDALADLIIGKEVKDAADQHYVRRQNQDVVYVVKIDPDRFSTDFEEWIEDDLLQIDPSDIRSVEIKDYSFEIVIEGPNVYPDWRRRGVYTLSYDDAESKWVAEKLQKFDPAQGEAGDYVADDLTDAETIDEEVLGDLRDALDDLRIVDVESKPSGLSGNLKVSSDFVEKLDRSSSSSLFNRGFAPIRTEDGQSEIVSSEGEVIVTMKDGVEYVLRFGNVDSDDEAASQAKPKADGDADGEDEENGANRYLFVVTRFNESVIDKPELEEVPEAPVASGEGAEEVSEEAGDETEVADETGEAEEAGDAEAGSERDAALRRNKERLEAYEARLADGRKRVDELNERFGDWYYVVADSVYSKIRLGRADFVKAEEPKEDAEGEEDAEAGDASVLGAPGSALPGLPSIDLDSAAAAADESDAASEPTDEAIAEETAEESTEETSAEENAAETASEESE